MLCANYSSNETASLSVRKLQAEELALTCFTKPCYSTLAVILDLSGPHPSNETFRIDVTCFFVPRPGEVSGQGTECMGLAGLYFVELYKPEPV